MQRDIDGQPTVYFAVTDTGRGLPREVLERLYEAFFSTKHEKDSASGSICAARSWRRTRAGISAENLYNAADIVGCRFSFWIPVGPQGTVTRSTNSIRIVA